METTRPKRAQLRSAALFAQYARQGFVDAKRALITISPGSTFTPGSAKVTAHRLLTRAIQNPEIMNEISKIMSPDEVKELFSSFARDESKPDHTRLRATEDMAKVHAMLTERSINENTNREFVDLRDVSTDKLGEELTNRLKLSATGVSTQVVEDKGDNGTPTR